MVTRIDAHFGNILAALEDPDNDGDTADSIADNTLVIFQSDNGGPSGKNNRELDANGGLRGSKGKIQEGGIRVPLVMRWPAKINSASALKAGSNSNMIVDITDLLPTFCELAGASTPLGIDGVSIAATLCGSGHQRKREFIIHEAGNGQSIIRGKYKLVRSRKSPGKYFTLELYNLENDHTEQNDIASDRPNLVRELEVLLLGERVAEPKGFANTYHYWTGENGGNTSDPDNWSDYVYANAGVTYITDNGAPQRSWTARVENPGDQSNTARADTDVEFLGLEIRGNKEKNAEQFLVVGRGTRLAGRNQIRGASNATLTVDAGTVASLRWIDIHAGGTLNGSGTIESTIYNNGVIVVRDDHQPGFNISRDYHQSAHATLNLSLTGNMWPSLLVAGDAILSGTLVVTSDKGFQPTPGQTYTVLTANRIIGTFSNPGREIVAADGSRRTLSLKATRARDNGQSQAAALKGHVEEVVTSLKSGTGRPLLLQR